MSNEIDSRDWPDWLVRIAVRVDGMVQSERSMARFRRMVAEWKMETRRRRPGYDPVDAFPARHRTLAHKYAVLGAIHDAVGEGVKRIDPWKTESPLKKIGIAKAKAGMAYAVLCGQVGDLREPDRAPFESWCGDVEDDLATLDSSTDMAPSHPGRARRPLDAVTPSDPSSNHSIHASGSATEAICVGKQASSPVLDCNDTIPALIRSTTLVVVAMAEADVSELLTTAELEKRMRHAGTPLSRRTIGDALKRLIELNSAERPHGRNGGARLTAQGRSLARQRRKIAD